jgi:uncharacterized protein
MVIKHESKVTSGAFFIEESDKRPAKMTYVMSGPTVMIIDHTEVSTALKGQGVGKQLVAAAVQFGRENGVKIVPLCPFARAEFDKNPEYHDLLLP